MIPTAIWKRRFNYCEPLMADYFNEVFSLTWFFKNLHMQMMYTLWTMSGWRVLSTELSTLKYMEFCNYNIFQYTLSSKLHLYIGYYWRLDLFSPSRICYSFAELHKKFSVHLTVRDVFTLFFGTFEFFNSSKHFFIPPDLCCIDANFHRLFLFSQPIMSPQLFPIVFFLGM